jgi:hypothetical protein
MSIMLSGAHAQFASLGPSMLVRDSHNFVEVDLELPRYRCED